MDINFNKEFYNELIKNGYSRAEALKAIKSNKIENKTLKAVRTAFPELNTSAIETIANWYDLELEDFDSIEECADYIRDDFLDMYWAGDYNNDDFLEVKKNMIEAGYFESDDFPDSEEE